MRASFRLALICLGVCAFSPPVRAESALVHIVRPGETLASIAELWYGDPRRESVLVAENGLNTEGGSAIEVGLRLVVPTVSYHRVEEGETWPELATRYYGDPKRAFVLIEANNGKAGRQPDPGAVLLIPYPLRYVADEKDPLRKVAKLFYDSTSAMNTVRRFNEAGKQRITRGQILLVPLADLVLSPQGKKLAEDQLDEEATGEIREKQARIDEELPTLREHVRAGRYADAVAMANRLIGAGDLTGNQIVTIHRELGTALCALGRDDLSREAFVVLLEQQPDAELDGVRTSPKVLRIFEQARKAVASAEPAQAPPREVVRNKKKEPRERERKSKGGK